MKITAIDNTNLRNAEHYQFQTDFKGLVEKKHPCCIEYCCAIHRLFCPSGYVNDLKLAYKAPAKTIITD